MRLLQSRSHATQRIHNVATGGCSLNPFLKKALAAKSHRQKNPLARLTGVNLCTNASCTTRFDRDLGQARCVQAAQKASRLTTRTAASQEASSPPQPPELSTRVQAAGRQQRPPPAGRCWCQGAGDSDGQALVLRSSSRSSGLPALQEQQPWPSCPRVTCLFLAAQPCRCTAALSPHILLPPRFSETLSQISTLFLPLQPEETLKTRRAKLCRPFTPSARQHTAVCAGRGAEGSSASSSTRAAPGRGGAARGGSLPPTAPR